jgi:FkbM family methyltransferase
MLKKIKNIINKLLHFIDIEIQRVNTDTPHNRLNKALKYFDIDTVLDVGANAGQFGSNLKDVGFKGRIISFEPLQAAYEDLLKKAQKFPDWIIHSRGAVGDIDGEITINISGNSVSSSILAMNAAHSDAAKDSQYIGSEITNINKIDSVAAQYLKPHNKTFLKIDTQGFEWQVLDGAMQTLPQIQGLLLELSLVELYEGQRLYRDIIKRLEALGFSIWTVERGFTDPSNGRSLQCDIVFFRVDKK